MITGIQAKVAHMKSHMKLAAMKNFSADFRMIFMRATFPCVIPILRENY